MKTMHIHLAFIGLLLILGLTLIVSFPFSLYFFATLKASIILFIFMNVLHAEDASRLYLFIAASLIAIAIGGFLDDLVFRGY